MPFVTRKTKVDVSLVCRQPRIFGLALSDRHSKVRSHTVAVRIWVAAQAASLCVAMDYPPPVAASAPFRSKSRPNGPLGSQDSRRRNR